MYDVEAVRAHFPALVEGAAHFDSPGGSQVPDVVAAAVADTLTSAIANRGRVTTAERRAEDIVTGARQAMADLLGAQPAGVVFGRSMTQLTFDVSRALAKQWGPGDEVVVTRLDHDANIRPWVHAAAAAGATLRWADFDRNTGELPVESVAAVLSDRTRVVAVTGASNLLGTRPDIPAIAAAAHRVGALCYVDGVHLTPHAAVDIEALGADFYVCSPYKFCGPHLGVLAGSPALLEQLHPDKLLPSSEAVPDRFEFGTLPYELLAGTTAAVDFLAGLAPDEGSVSGEGSESSRATRLRESMAAVDRHESAMLDRLEAGLAGVEGLTRYSRASRRTPLVLFSVRGHRPAEIYRQLAASKVNAPAGSFYAVECARWLGLGDEGAVRAGIAPYTNAQDIDRLVEAVADLA
ncbi:cysteine desulfurase-like protein [Rugosimonospora africana]|uniref:Cysteine desulfurase-like protein n=1 Tax=Rugosimonospora africana TaxID=556532 RepID=A0A8J3QPZ4_9ACTN|nr:cysteine desulfurase-like protein [Rugosimonospora africana]GIH14804.1 cysteine desulfurase-like protein [Rugosimonospora africana]